MVVELSGGCRVVDLKEGEPSHEGDLRVWQHFSGALSLRVLALDGEASLRNAEHDETLYVIDGEGTANGTRVGSDVGIDLPRGQTLRLSGRMTIVSSLCAAESSGRKVSIVSLRDRPLQKTGDRAYRELIQGETTQFVGTIPPGRAPEHFHLYEEVICILKGSGVMWAGDRSTAVSAGSCIFLPIRQRHCLENTSVTDLHLLGMFYPSGSPAVRYQVEDDADGGPEEEKANGP
jgi:mannose-6-phosphate isomerase-like protein (cupin superfamily)